MAYTIVLDAGHGGSDSGAVYNGRQEKDDSLRLTMEMGKILSNNGYNMIYTRTNDEYDTPFEKATIANDENADLFVSIHRNSSPVADMFNGIQTLVYSNNGIRANLARNINQNLVQLGFKNQARRLINSGYTAVLVNEKGLFKVWVGKYSSLDNAVEAEKKIKELGYDAYIRVVN
ncbi:MAG: N-acetylmuramoyl-L-alanine amidase [Lachnospiraceae bacterium]|nr:N-acetylmuramoyl-L-alanine amidase [Lachnospiraceae bacterium]